MKALDANSLDVLESAASLLCHTAEQRDMLQMVYSLGVTDGKIAALREQMARQDVQVPA